MTTEMAAGVMRDAVAKLGGRGPICMVNLLRYRAQATYAPGGVGADLPPCSGQEAYYTRYVPAFGAVPEADQSKIIWLGNAQAILVAPDGERWDDVAIVEYPTLDLLQRIVDHPEYQTNAAPHRLAALEDWRFIVTTAATPPA